MTAQLYCRVRSGLTLTFEVEGDEALIGRDAGLSVSVPVEGVSRRHARITWDGKAHWLQDLQSTNGTFLNGEAVRHERLRHLDVITLGRELSLIYLLRGEGYEPVRRKGITGARLVPLAGEATACELPVGETILGRSEACNVLVEGGAVSKMHARIERSADRLVVHDLGSSNGTFVNGVRARTGALRHGDEISLAGAAFWRVEVDLGEVTSASGAFTPVSIPAKTPGEETPGEEEDEADFSPEWKTRFDWDADEQAQIKAMREQLAVESGIRRQATPAGTDKPAASGATAPAPKVPNAPKPRPAEPRVASGRPPDVRPGPAGPVSSPRDVAATSKAAPEKPPKPAVPAPPPPKVTPPAPEAAAPEAAAPEAALPPAAEPTRPAPAVPEPAAPRKEPSRVRSATPEAPPSPEPVEATVLMGPADSQIIELRLSGEGVDLVVTNPGEYRLGRATDAELRIDHPTVSRRQARVRLGDDRQQAYLQHDAGANPTRLNDREAKDAEPLADGDTIVIGDVSLRVTLKRR